MAGASQRARSGVRPPSNGDMRVVGRARERLAIDEALDQVRAGLSATVVLRGDAGMGKTTLLEYARGAATGFTYASVVGVEAESSLPFAAIQRLLMPFLARVGDLPIPQRDALCVALGLAPGVR